MHAASPSSAQICEQTRSTAAAQVKGIYQPLVGFSRDSNSVSQLLPEASHSASFSRHSLSHGRNIAGVRREHPGIQTAGLHHRGVSVAAKTTYSLREQNPYDAETDGRALSKPTVSSGSQQQPEGGLKRQYGFRGKRKPRSSQQQPQSISQVEISAKVHALYDDRAMNDCTQLMKYLESVRWQGNEEELERLWKQIQVCLNESLSALSDQLNVIQ